MNTSTVYRVNSPGVVGEVIDGEAIIIHLETGTYYSARETAARVWELISAGASVGQIVERFTQEYDKGTLEVSFTLANFLTSLVTSRLIVENHGAAPADLTSLPIAEKRVYSEPKIEAYRDMQNLLMLDPIHEVEPGVGWPEPLSGDQS